MSGAAVLIGLAPAGDAYAAYAMTVLGRPDAAGRARRMGAELVLAAPAVAGLGRPAAVLPRRAAAVAPVADPRPRAAASGSLAAVVLGMLTGTLTGQDVDYRIENPIGIHGFAAGRAAAGVPGPRGAAGARGAAGDRRRRRPVPPVARRRAAADEVVPLRGGAAAAHRRCRGSCRPSSADLVFAWMLIAFPVAIAIAVLRYRLDGIDVVINRTLVYAPLTRGRGRGLRLRRRLPRARRSRRNGDLTISLVATGVVAVLFAPLRDRLQRGVDRLLYGRRSEPYAALVPARRAARGDARAGRRPARRSSPPCGRRCGCPTRRSPSPRTPSPSAAGAPADRRPVTLPLLHHGVPVGDLVLGLRPGEAAFSAADRRLLGRPRPAGGRRRLRRRG